MRKSKNEIMLAVLIGADGDCQFSCQHAHNTSWIYSNFIIDNLRRIQDPKLVGVNYKKIKSMDSII